MCASTRLGISARGRPNHRGIIAGVTRLALAAAAMATVCTTLPAQDGKTPIRRNLAGKGATTTMVALERTPDRGLQPQVAADAQGTVHLLYFKGAAAAGDVLYAKRPIESNDFGPPLRVNSQSGSAIAIGTIRGAQLALGRQDRVHVAWNGSNTAEPRGPNKQSPMLYTRLNDAGTGFEPQRNVVQTAYGLDGGGSVAADANGNVYVAWHGNPAGNGEGNRRVFVAHSSDDGATFSAELPAWDKPTGACGCCGMRALADSRGALYLLYRTAQATTNRDMFLLVSKDTGKSFQGDLMGKWQIAQCPMSSEAFVEGPSSVVCAWETDGQVFMGKIDPKKGTTSRSIAAPGNANGRKHPALAVNARGETLLVWTEGTGWERGGALAWQLFSEAGKPTATRGRADGIPVWSFAAAYAKPDGSFVILY